MNLAVVDMGSNSLHLQVVNPAGETLHVALSLIHI